LASSKHSQSGMKIGLAIISLSITQQWLDRSCLDSVLDQTLSTVPSLTVPPPSWLQSRSLATYKPRHLQVSNAAPSTDRSSRRASTKSHTYPEPFRAFPVAAASSAHSKRARADAMIIDCVFRLRNHLPYMRLHLYNMLAAVLESGVSKTCLLQAQKR
jgi:hypothetical protein